MIFEILRAFHCMKTFNLYETGYLNFTTIFNRTKETKNIEKLIRKSCSQLESNIRTDRLVISDSFYTILYYTLINEEN